MPKQHTYVLGLNTYDHDVSACLLRDGTIAYAIAKERIVRAKHASGFYREVNGEPWIQHDVEAFVKVDSKGWKALAKTVRPLLDKVLEDQVQEAGWFVSLMGRMVETHPNWACSVVQKQDQIDPAKRRSFQEIVLQVRRPDAVGGRPQLAENIDAGATTRRR